MKCLLPSGWLLNEALTGRVPGRDVARNRRAPVLM